MRAALIGFFELLAIDVDHLDTSLPQDSETMFRGYNTSYLEAFVTRREHPYVMTEDRELGAVFREYMAATQRVELDDEIFNECYERVRSESRMAQ